MRKMTLTLTICSALVLGLAAAPLFAPSSSADDAAPAANVDHELYAIGGLSAADLWTTYVLIGAMGDSFAKKSHTAEQVQKLMAPRSNFNQKAAESLGNIMEQPELPLSEKAHLAAVNEAYAALTTYANSLVAFTKEPSKENVNAFQKNRKAAWAKIAVVLGIDNDSK